MTVDDHIQTSRLLLPNPPTFYNAKIPFKHWQLRSLLSSPSLDVLYYPSNNRVYSLNTATRKRRQIASLPFGPRCIGARYGWVCVGGAEDGNFASIRVGKSTSAGNAGDGSGHGMDVEDESRSSVRSPRVNFKKLGGTIVNSVTLHKPPSSSSTSDEDVLAVLTNNDKTVRIFHLAQNRVIATLHVEVPTNHASISPDGQHLVVVGDAPTVYFYHPVSGSCRGQPGTGIGEAGCGSWILSSHPPLMAGEESDALMSTSFSPSSRRCAVASQAGIITIFDTRYLSLGDQSHASPIVKVIHSSRSHTESGAVRSVQFSPAPWDLLVWAEHCGRVCVADARSDFARRQVVDVAVGKEDLVEADIEEVQDLPSAWELSQSPGGPISTSASAPASREDDPEALDGENTSANELAELVLESSREYLATYTTRFPLFGGSSSARHNPAGPSISSSPQSALLRSYRERQLERDRARQRIPHDPPRRRNSVHPAYEHSDDYGPIDASMVESRRVRRFHADSESASWVYSHGTVASDSMDITGCTLSTDGRKLYVATDGGVYEYAVDVGGRRIFPSIALR